MHGSAYDVLYLVMLGGAASAERFRRNDLDLRVPLRFVPVSIQSEVRLDEMGPGSFHSKSDTQKMMATKWMLRETADRMGLRNIAA